MKNIVIFGAPGAGKGTQSDYIVERFGLQHISTGELLRKEIADKTPLGLRIKDIMDAGQLVSDDIVVEMIDNAIAHNDCGILFDGFPRNVAQAEILYTACWSAPRPADVATTTKRQSTTGSLNTRTKPFPWPPTTTSRGKRC